MLFARRNPQQVDRGTKMRPRERQPTECNCGKKPVVYQASRFPIPQGICDRQFPFAHDQAAYPGTTTIVKYFAIQSIAWGEVQPNTLADSRLGGKSGRFACLEAFSRQLCAAT